MLFAYYLPTGELDRSIELVPSIQQGQLRLSSDRIASGKRGENGCLVDHVGVVAQFLHLGRSFLKKSDCEAADGSAAPVWSFHRR
jgi:hypothetical protein